MYENSPEAWGVSDETSVAHDSPYSMGALSPPIYQTSLFTFPTVEAMVERFSGKNDLPIYSRADNPTVREFEKKIAKLEGAQGARAFASGMAAISSAILSVVESGDRIVCVKHIYPDAYRFFNKLLAQLNIKVEYIDGNDLSAMEKALPGARVLYLESPTSVVFEQHDVRALCELAKQNNVISIIDNSWATPIFQKPIALGVDMVIHSASKYLGGHSDTVAGVVATSRKFVEQMNDRVIYYLGAKLSPMEAWLLLRGLRTLPIRMKEHHTNALTIAQRLSEHPGIEKINHPGISTPQSPIRSRLKGYSGLFSIELHESYDVVRFCNALNIFRLGVSWGGYESLAFPMEVGLRQAGEFNSLVDFGVSPKLVRLHVGLENVEDLLNDLHQALNVAK